MRIYTPSSEETLRARQYLADWAGEGFLTEDQYQRLQQETVSELRTTNIFLRMTLFFFTLIGVGATIALFYVVFLSRASQQTTGVFLLVFTVLCYAATEVAVSKAHLHRYGIEEALAACSVGFLCVGIQLAFFSGSSYTSASHIAQCLVPVAGAVFSLWIWRRFGLWYAFLAAMIFAVFLPGYWTSSPAAERMVVAAFYASGLISVAAVRSRHRFDCLDGEYSLAEALLWLGIYLAINLKISSLDLRMELWGGGSHAGSEFSKPFYWTTWALTWILPAVILTRGVRRRDRFVLAVGIIVAILTFVSNKPYLGWPRHTWDPMLLGILLTGNSLLIRRWLARGPGGVRRGFTAVRLSGKDKHWMNVASPVLGLVTPQSITPSPQPTSSDFHFDGGSSGGGGASGDF